MLCAFCSTQSACVLHEIEDAKASPASFTCTSGTLLWGQVHTVIEGFASTEVDTELGPQQGNEGGSSGGGTVLASSFRYRVAARKGEWKAEAAFLESSEGEPWHVGFACHHVDVDGVEVLRRAAEAGLGGNGKFADLGIVFVDRYDWSGSRSSGCERIMHADEGKEVDGEEDVEDERYNRSLVQGRFMLVDAQGFPNLMQALKDGHRLERRNYVLRTRTDSGSPSSVSQAVAAETLSSDCGSGRFGIHLTVDGSEYDLGWMAFRNGELVGFVYDGAYCALEGDNLSIGNNLVTAQ